MQARSDIIQPRSICEMEWPLWARGLEWTLWSLPQRLWENRHVFQKSDALSNNFTPIPEIPSIIVEASPETYIIGVIKQNKNTRLHGERLNMATIAQPY